MKHFINKFVSLLLMFMMIEMGSAHVSAFSISDNQITSSQDQYSSGKLVLHGTPGTLAVVPTFLDCKNTAQTFVNCDDWLPHVPSDGDYYGTTVIIDDALSVNEWKMAETDAGKGYYVDIIKYVTVDSSNQVVTFGSDGKDTLTGVTDAQLGSVKSHNHGHMVLSAFATIARKANVIFISVADHTGLGFQYPYLNSDLWNWIYRNRLIYNIQTISMSSSYSVDYYYFDVDNIITKLYNNGIYMLTSIGNDGKYGGNGFPQRHKYFYTVGSIDHENRGGFRSGWLGSVYWDYDYMSSKGHYSGYADASPLLSSYGSTSSTSAEALDFVMPGNGVPIASATWGVLYYYYGTSFSTPYLAAAAMIAHYAYVKGYSAVAGTTQYSDSATIHALLKGAASRSTYNYRYGWGYVDLGELYNEAYSAGYAAYVPTCPPYPLTC